MQTRRTGIRHRTIMTYRKRRKIVRAFTPENYTINGFPDTERKKMQKKKAAPFGVALFL